MRIGRGRISLQSDLTVDQDIDFLTLYQAKRLASPASGEALRKGNKDITNAEIADAAAIAISKLVNTYLPETLLTTRGDICYRAASNPARLGKGSAGLFLKQGADDPEWAASVITPAVAGDIVEIASVVSQTKNETVYTKWLEIKLGRGGEFRIKFDLSVNTVDGVAFARVYKNGVAFGTEQSEATASWVTKSEDISGWSKDDLCQLYMKHSTGSYYAMFRNFTIYTDNPILHTEM